MKTRKMKLWTLTLFTLIGLTISWGQGIADKKTQAGLTGTFGLNVLRMGTELMNSNGVGSNLGIGIMAHSSFKNSKNLGLAYGIEFEFGTFKFAPEFATGYNYNDKSILTFDESNVNDNMFLLLERTQKPVYLTIPIMFLFRTDFIGDFRYFGKFGVRNNFLVSNKMNDNGVKNPLTTNTYETTELLNMKATGETFFYHGSVGMTAGAEWNFVGSTSLVAEAGYFYGITPLFLDRTVGNESLFIYNSNGERAYFSNNANLSQILLKVSILF